jgi:hypothetical protein
MFERYIKMLPYPTHFKLLFDHFPYSKFPLFLPELGAVYKICLIFLKSILVNLVK